MCVCVWTFATYRADVSMILIIRIYLFLYFVFRLRWWRQRRRRYIGMDSSRFCMGPWIYHFDIDNSRFVQHSSSQVKSICALIHAKHPQRALSRSLSISLSAPANGIDLIRRQATHIHKHRHATIIHRLENLMWRERNFVSPIDTQWCSFLAPKERWEIASEEASAREKKAHTWHTHTHKTRT